MSTDRLTELQRQRALAQAQVEWFEREIARETLRSPENAPASTPPVVPTASRVTRRAAPKSFAAASADELISRYGDTPSAAVANAKRGCAIYFIAALTLLIIGVLAAYFFYTRYR